MVKIVIGVLATAYCVMQIVQLVHVLNAEKGAMQQSSAAAGAGLALLAGAIAIVCFRSVLSRTK